jgi:hypothetical protein
MTAAATVDRAASGPFRYLDYFQESDRFSFAGREDDIAEVAARASGDEPLVLYGRSGLGKTSLLLAGVFPLLRDRRLRPIRVRTFEQPDIDLRNALAAELGLESADTVHDLPELVERLAHTEGLVLAFDQFEEFFISTRSRPAPRREFIHLLATLVRHPGWDVRLTISLREDYLAELDEFRDEFPDILSNQYRLLPLTAFGARQAIVAPLVLANIPFDQQLVVRLVDLLAVVDFDPVLLQIACGEVYREAIKRRRDDIRLTEADLDRVGGIQGLFERYLDNAISRVPRGMLLLSRAVLDALITPEETKRAITFEALLGNDDFKASREELEAVLDCLKQQKIVRGDLRTGHLWYELAHDRLAKSVVKWFKRDADFAQFRDARDLIAEAERRVAFPARLETLIGRLQIDKLINPYRERLRLTSEQRALMLWSAIYGQADNVEFWGALAGPARCEEALLALLEHTAPEARLGAAHAAARLAGDSPAVVRACADRALEDPDAGVRQAAAVVLSRHANEEDLSKIATALKSRRSRRRALDVLATFAATGGPIDRFSSVSRLLARWHARRRALAANRNTILARGSRGVLVGFLGSAAWTTLIGVPMALSAIWANGEIQWLRSAAPYASAAGIVGAIVGIAGGWWLARASAKRAALTGTEGRWGSLILGIPATLLAVGWLALAVIMIPEPGGLWPTIVSFAPTAVLLFVMLAPYAYLMRVVVWPPHSTRRGARIFWAFLAGLPVAVPIAAVGFLRPSDAGALWAAAGVASALATIVTLVLSETAAAFPIGTFPPIAARARFAGRGLILAAAAAAVASLWLTLGLDSVPLAVNHTNVDGGGRFGIRLRSRLDSEYFRLVATDSSARWFLVTLPKHVLVKGAATNLAYLDSMSGLRVVHIPSGRYLLSATPDGSSPTSDGALEIAPIAPLNAGDVVRLSGTKWTPFVLQLNPGTDSKGKPIWRADVPVRVEIGLAIDESQPSLRILPLVNGVEFTHPDVTDGSQAAKERLITYPQPQPLALFTANHLTPLYLTSREMQPLAIENAEARVEVTYRPPANISLPRTPILLPVGLKLKVLDWTRDWNNPTALAEAAEDYLLKKWTDDALKLLERVAELKPDDYLAQNEYAWNLVLEYRGAEGLSAARQAAKLTNRTNPSVLDTLGHVEHAAGNWAEAVKAWEDLLVADPAYYKPVRDPFCEHDLSLLEEARRKVRDGA